MTEPAYRAWNEYGPRRTLDPLPISKHVRVKLEIARSVAACLAVTLNAITLAVLLWR